MWRRDDHLAGQEAVHDCSHSSLRGEGSRHGQLLQLDETGDAALGEAQQRQELVLGERLALGRPLHLDETAGAGDDEIGVGLGRRSSA